VFGWIAFVGLAVFVVALAAAGISEALGFRETTDFPLGVTMLAGIGIVLVFWPLWGTWSAMLDKEPPGPIRPKTKATLALTVLLVLGALVLVAGIATGMLLEDGPEWVAQAAFAATATGSAIVGLALLAAAIAGGVVLGGAGWWWVGVVLTAGMIGVAFGLTFAIWPLVVGSVVALLVAGWGYHAALRAGLRARRPDAIEAERERQASRG
jgi:hypothetical protein